MTRQEALAEQERLFPRKLWREYVTTETPAPGNVYNGMPVMLPEICLQLRASLNGSSDPWDSADVFAVRNMLVAREATWMPSEDPIDAAVLAMLRATVAMTDREFAWAAQPNATPPA